MDRTDADMMEEETSPPPPPPPPQQLLRSPNSSDNQEVVKGLLTLARQLINQSQPSRALQAVAIAMTTIGGDEALSRVFSRAQALYRSKLQAPAAADELASLFAECAIAEAMPSEADPSHHNIVVRPIEPDAEGTSILAESGRKQIVMDAFSDGSSFVCLQCGGLSLNAWDARLVSCIEPK